MHGFLTDWIRVRSYTAQLRSTAQWGNGQAIRDLKRFPPMATVDGLARLRGIDDYRMDGRPMYIFVPVRHVRKTIVGIELAPQKAAADETEASPASP